MFLDDSLQHFGRRRVIPDTVGIDDCDRPLLADPQAVGLGAINAVFTLQEATLSKPLLQIIPGDVGDLAGSAFRIGLVGAKKDVAAERADAEDASFVGRSQVW